MKLGGILIFIIHFFPYIYILKSNTKYILKCKERKEQKRNDNARKRERREKEN